MSEAGDGSGAREEVLRRVRAAIAGAPPVEPVAPVPGVVHQDGERLLALFAERVADYRATVVRCRPEELAERLEQALAGCAGVVVPDGFDVAVPAGRPDAGSDGVLSALELDGVDAVVTTCAVAVAETGTIVLDHGPGQGRRALSLVPDRHVCVVAEEQVVADVPDAVARLDPLRPQTWISGPSATSDIELDRVEGVHGPRHLHVLLVGPGADREAAPGAVH